MERGQLGIGSVWINGAVCLQCKEFVRSKNRHDFRTCKCGKVMVDGGSHYCRRIGEPDDFIDVIETYEDDRDDRTAEQRTEETIKQLDEALYS